MSIIPRFCRAVGRTFFAVLLAGMMTPLSAAQESPDEAQSVRWAIALHGGAGSWSRKMDEADRRALEQSLERALAVGKEVLSAGGTALDAVEAVVVALEDDPRFNAGKGAVFTRAGDHELDASIMDGATLRCGAVAAVRRLKNPIKAARLVMERTPHVLLGGESADRFALEHGCEAVEQSYFYNARRFRALQQALEQQGLKPLERPTYDLPIDQQGDASAGAEEAGNTVGCVALDAHGNLAAATSTGGRTGKMSGRIGDSPICGAGNYANQTCAVSGTGRGEEFIRHSIGARVAWLMEDRQLPLDEAVRHCVEKILQPGDGGVIAVDRQGRVAMHSTTDAMPRGVADSSGRFEVAIWFEQ